MAARNERYDLESNSSQGSSAESQNDLDPKKHSTDEKTPTWVWKSAAFGFAALFLLSLIIHAYTWFAEKSAGSESRPLISDSRKASTTEDIDSELIGTWQMQANQDIWQLVIHSNATYEFSSHGPSGQMKHSGDFRAKGGLWSMRSRTNSWFDKGKYSLVGGNILTTQGRLGTGQWHRGQQINFPHVQNKMPAWEKSFRENNGILPPR